MIAVVDYGAGNLNSVLKALEYLDVKATVTADCGVINSAAAIILPGVGSFGDAMSNIRERGLESALKKAADGEKPFLGICLGQQLLFEGSDESPGVAGLAVLKGRIKGIPRDRGLKVPHIGWNSLEFPRNTALFQGIGDQPYVYFVHSCYLQAQDREIVAATANYGVQIDAAVNYKNLYAVQFHPEKSGDEGIKILDNFFKYYNLR